jgi:formate dehydrogenase iron-sulfur subunit
MSSLPLLKRAVDDGVTFALTRRTDRGIPLGLTERGPDNVRSIDPVRVERMPSRTPGPGEQYRFHFDMRKCIGCKCCVVACNEQNGNPAAINWRRVGEIEGGFYPNATRSYLSMGCNHCLEPTCLKGCPVDAYTKDPVTGIVRHSADACIGCQYCTWNCSYGVPQFNPERGVVGKCDMCHGRLELGQTPACVNACPEGAIQIEIVSTADWRASVAAAVGGAGTPVADGSLSTTRVTVSELAPNAKPHDITHVVPADPHWPLVVMTVLTQLSVGAFAAIWLLQLLTGTTRLGVAAISSLMVGGLALSASTLHLGRPAFAYRALRMWKRSWLSREVLLFSLFSAVATAYAAGLWFGIAASTFIGAVTVVFGLAGVCASACIYRVPSRPSWNTPYTLVHFTLTAAVLGPLFAAAVGAGHERWLAIAAALMAGVQLVVLLVRFLRLIASDSLELRGTARLISTVLASRFILRSLLLTVGAIVLPLVVAGPSAIRQGTESTPVAALAMVIALALSLGGEILGRYLFFVSAVPKHMASPYVAIGSEAV